MHVAFDFCESGLHSFPKESHQLPYNHLKYTAKSTIIFLPRGGPCVIRISIPSGIRFHFSNSAWPRGRLKPQP